MSDWLSGLIAQPEGKKLRGHALRVAEALKTGPMTTLQLKEATGLSIPQIREVFRQHLGIEFESTPLRYSLKPTHVGKVAASEK